jgi:hypothetical protein
MKMSVISGGDRVFGDNGHKAPRFFFEKYEKIDAPLQNRAICIWIKIRKGKERMN